MSATNTRPAAWLGLRRRATGAWLVVAALVASPVRAQEAAPSSAASSAPATAPPGMSAEPTSESRNATADAEAEREVARLDAFLAHRRTQARRISRAFGFTSIVVSLLTIPAGAVLVADG